jgi:hypothetical protein
VKGKWVNVKIVVENFQLRKMVIVDIVFSVKKILKDYSEKVIINEEVK